MIVTDGSCHSLVLYSICLISLTLVFSLLALLFLTIPMCCFCFIVVCLSTSFFFRVVIHSFHISVGFQYVSHKSPVSFPVSACVTWSHGVRSRRASAASVANVRRASMVGSVAETLKQVWCGRHGRCRLWSSHGGPQPHPTGGSFIDYN